MTRMVCVLMVLVAACGDDDDGGGAADAATLLIDANDPPDAAPPIDAMPLPDAVICSTLANQGQVVQQLAIAEAPPAPTGGTIGDGTYVVTGWDVYTGVGGQAGQTGNTIKATSQNTGNNFEYVEDMGGGDTLFAGTFSTTNETITINITCPPPPGMGSLAGFTETVDGFILYGPLAGFTEARTYTKVP